MNVWCKILRYYALKNKSFTTIQIIIKMGLPGFEPGLLAPKARFITKLEHNSGSKLIRVIIPIKTNLVYSPSIIPANYLFYKVID